MSDSREELGGVRAAKAVVVGDLGGLDGDVKQGSSATSQRAQSARYVSRSAGLCPISNVSSESRLTARRRRFLASLNG